MSNSNKIYSIVATIVVTFVFVAKETDALLLTQHGTNPLTDESVFGHFTWGGEVSGKKNILGNVLNKLVIPRKQKLVRNQCGLHSEATKYQLLNTKKS